jgi:RNA polymerase sigma-70 factor (ECF subfamily)
MSQDEERMLLQRLQAGDAKAFKTVFQRYFKLLYTEAYYKLENDKEAEDLVQDFFIEFWEKQLFRSVTVSLKYYCYQSIRNRCINRLEHRKVQRRRTDQYAQLQPQSYQPANKMENNELRDQIENALEAIPPESAKIFRLSYLEQHKRKEIAGLLGISENTVKTQLARALRHFREKMFHFK